MILRAFISILLMLGAAPALSQDSRAQTSENMREEQAAICASYAQIMEYAGLIDSKQGEIWGERKLYAAALLYNTVAESTELEARIRHIDEVIDNYSIWMIEIFANLPNLRSEQSSGDDRDALKAYIGNFCIQIFTQADKAIAKLRPHLFAVKKPPLPQITPAVAPHGVHIQIAAYSTKKAAENGLKKMQKDLEHYRIRFSIKDATKDDPLFRIVSDSISPHYAEEICAIFREKKQGCIIKMTNR